MILSEARNNTTRGIAPAVLYPVFSFPLSVEVGFSEFCTQEKAVLFEELKSKLRNPTVLGCESVRWFPESTIGIQSASPWSLTPGSGRDI